ncbi:LLM class flavin-dependent oxidoreductase [Mycolicibacterium mucogenicum]|uniref:LLM class flavin-dependent oxidoreductase n=1 Tax=Mycolicibacterium mucogenicum TaxID=56689 RepID=UPI00226AD61A|nr:LLM class flavin-dependent oxidoreductase [Mycolicibacterium mucogenicum]MCX8560732.1 LLM class flavin-dependent oxidoreductase [Mycolicibacterium mucogenicum]
MAEWFLFLPQVRLSVGEIVERAQVAEASGFDGIAFIDHLEAPGAPDRGIWDATAIAAWVAAHTQRLRVGHLVLCDGFRHPAVLAKHAVTMSAASGGRFELGLGAGSMPAEFERFDIDNAHDAPARFSRLEHDLALIRQYWGDDGDNAQYPRREHPIPLVLGGVGKKTMELVRRHADWWNLPCSHLDRLEDLRAHAGDARVSVQQMVGFVGSGADRTTVTETSTRRFGYLGGGLACGTADELTDHFGRMSELGAERFYVWFADFAQADTLREFAETVVKAA